MAILYIRIFFNCAIDIFKLLFNENIINPRIARSGGGQCGVLEMRCRWVGVFSSHNFNKYNDTKWVVYNGLTSFLYVPRY